MAVTSKALFRGAASTSTTTTLYTVPSATTTVVTNIVVANTASSSATYTLSLNDEKIAEAVTVAGNDSAILDMKQVLSATHTIKGGASTSGIKFHISGVEIS